MRLDCKSIARRRCTGPARREPNMTRAFSRFASFAFAELDSCGIGVTVAAEVVDDSG